MPRLLKALSWNTKDGGAVDEDGVPANRWRDQVKLIAAQEPDVVFLQEMRDFADQAVRARWEDELAAHGRPLRLLVAPSSDRNHTVLGYDPACIRLEHWDDRWSHLTAMGFGVATVVAASPDSPIPDGMRLRLASLHLFPGSRLKALQDAELIIGRLWRKGGQHAIVGGDVNYCPEGDPEPMWERLPRNVQMARCEERTHPTDVLRADFSIARKLEAGRLVDVARALYLTDGDDAHLDATGQLRVRVDQFHVTEPLRRAIRNYHRLDTTTSDHSPIVSEYDLASADTPRQRALELRPARL
ncbi:endonuclease/exonuclease/phosphatase family protein [Actinomadura rayongensis]|uniref:Endonuclease/exonuclease/phosphatase domain-containing protein n=1 Tax=Actinomadura rayongensis TaxID=1429076 RepID=A0A6I4WBG6_9ACTN|nr:endonuclease/exonuclease/phosphatase family protein [Actinomadura rayongensis]MXQ65595.1 hypothetical protein [Actinomadura rayongensis]